MTEIESLFGPALTKQWRQAMLQRVPVIWIHTVSSERNRTRGPSAGARRSGTAGISFSSGPFPHDHRRGGQEIQLDGLAAAVDLAELEHARGAALDARGAADAFGILHGEALVGEVHDVNALVADRGAHVARDALLLVRHDREAAEPRVDVHQRGEGAQEAAPDASREPEVEPVADHARQEHVHEPLVRGLQEWIEDGIDRVSVRK